MSLQCQNIKEKQVKEELEEENENRSREEQAQAGLTENRSREEQAQAPQKQADAAAKIVGDEIEKLKLGEDQSDLKTALGGIIDKIDGKRTKDELRGYKIPGNVRVGEEDVDVPENVKNALGIYKAAKLDTLP